MAKKLFGWLLAVPALLGIGLTSCSSEEPVGKNNNSEKQIVHLSMTASIGNQTRATLTPEGKILKFKWEKDDQIKIVNAENGEYLGKMDVKEVLSDPTKCKFDGDVSMPSGKVTLNFYYLGKKGVMVANSSNNYIPGDLEMDFSTQQGTAAELYDYDILCASKTYENGVGGGLGSVNFERNLSYGRFILKYNGEEINVSGKNVTISANTGNLYNKTSLNFKTQQYSKEEGQIVVTPQENSFYVTFVPTSAVNLKFTVDMGNGEIFEGTKGKELLSDTYYSAAEGAPIVVEMKHVDGRDDQKQFKLIYDQNFREENVRISSVADGVTDLSYSFTVSSYEALQYNEKKEGYDFKCWNTKADGSGDNYEVGSYITLTYNTQLENKGLEQILYAVWEKSTIDYKVTLKYDDDTTKEISNPSKEDEVSVSLPGDGNTNPTKEGYEFLGWKEEGTDGPVSKDSWTLTKDKPQVVLVPAWKENPGIINPGYGSGNWGR